MYKIKTVIQVESGESARFNLIGSMSNPVDAIRIADSFDLSQIKCSMACVLVCSGNSVIYRKQLNGYKLK